MDKGNSILNKLCSFIIIDDINSTFPGQPALLTFSFYNRSKNLKVCKKLIRNRHKMKSITDSFLLKQKIVLTE